MILKDHSPVTFDFFYFSFNTVPRTVLYLYCVLKINVNLFWNALFQLFLKSKGKEMSEK